MSHGIASSLPMFKRSLWQFLVLGLTVAAYSLGAYGFWAYDQAHHHPPDLSSSLYHAAQLFILHAPALEPPLNWHLEVGRWLALGLFLLAALITTYRLFSKELSAIRLSLSRDHIVICGRGSTLKTMVRLQRAKKPRRLIVVITDTEESALIEECHSLRAVVLTGSPISLLKKARITRAERLIAIYPEDSLNVEIAVVVCALSLKERSSTIPWLKCFAQVCSVDLRYSLRRHHLPLQGGKCQVHFFDFFDDVARELLLKSMPIDRGGILKDDNRQAHLIVIGLGTMGQRLLVKAAQLGHFANQRNLRISVIDEAAEKREQELLFRYPGVRETCDLKFYGLEIQSERGCALIDKLCAADDILVGIVTTLENDAVALDIGMRLVPIVQGKQIPIAVRMSRSDGLTALVRKGLAPPEASPSLCPFGWLDEACLGRLLDNDEREELAAFVQVEFLALAQSTRREEALDEAMKAWEDLSNEDYKESNRQQVDHIPIKLRAIGCEEARVSDPRPAHTLRREEVDLLAKMEHRRWMAERRLAGWKYGEGQKDEVKRTNPNLVPWELLTEESKRYDENAVKAIASLLSTQNKKICRRLPSSLP